MPDLSWLDWTILLILAVAVLAGVRRGYVLGVLDLAGVAIALGVASVAYKPVAELLQGYAPIPALLAAVAAYMLVLVLTHFVFSIGVRIVLGVTSPIWKVLKPLGPLDHLLGSIPGAIKGSLLLVVFLVPFTIFHFVPQVSDAINASPIASWLTNAALQHAPDVTSLVPADLPGGLSMMTPAPTEDGSKINFGNPGDLTPDPAAETAMLGMVNSARQAAGLGTLQADDHLRDVARQHSLEMFQMGYFAHDSPVSGSPFDRMRTAHVPFLIAGENLAYAPNVDSAHEGLMNSPGHRANILRREFGRVGIGVIKSALRGSMFSQEFTN